MRDTVYTLYPPINNLSFSHPICTSSSAVAQSRNPRRSAATPAVSFNRNLQIRRTSGSDKRTSYLPAGTLGIVGTILASWCVCVACGPTASGETEHPTAVGSAAEKTEPAPVENGEANTAVAMPNIVGTWLNGSCGDRQYEREVQFLEGGRFLARDLVAPCPENVACVWSGIIPWRGEWKVFGKDIKIQIAPPEKGQRTPQSLPTNFVVLNNATISVGEQNGTLVCPYRKAAK